MKDQAYTTEQIQQALQTADHRMKMIILLLASTGCRIGALPSLTLGNLQKLPDYGLYKITFYEGSNNEYYSFTTRESASTGIENYLFYRQRSPIFVQVKKQVLEEYLKAEPLLTIDSSLRLQQEVQTLRVEKQSFEEFQTGA